ncbi:MAG TPA: M67 family metallopeptidase [Nitrospiria bacterium]|jgi:proteasome lid subunit RPN8/RPN11|nr:M67 family metallopeptidase [Nitrospiria bacterium]
MLSIPKQFYDAMIQQAQSEHPNECCGLLAGKDGGVSQLYKIKNIVALEGLEAANFDDAKLAHLKSLSPEDRAEIAFAMDAREMSSAFKDMRLNDIKLQVVYHSHPHGPNRPSVTDIKNAIGFDSMREKLNLPEPLHIIISLQKRNQPEVKAYRIVEDQTTLEEFKIVG